MDGVDFAGFLEGVVGHIDERCGRGVAWLAALLLVALVIVLPVCVVAWLAR